MNKSATLLLVLLCCLMTVGFSRKPKFVITVHSPGSEMDSPKSIFPAEVNGRTVIFRKVPEISDFDMSAFHPFPADDGTYGIAMKLDFKGANALEMVTRIRHGEALVTMLNGRPIDVVRIDRPVTDGIFTIWHGIPEEIIAVLDKKYPRIKDLKSSSEFLDMAPSTSTEKKQARKKAEEAARKRMKEGEAGAEELLDAPAAKDIPRE